MVYIQALSTRGESKKKEEAEKKNGRVIPRPRGKGKKKKQADYASSELVVVAESNLKRIISGNRALRKIEHRGEISQTRTKNSTTTKERCSGLCGGDLVVFLRPPKDLGRLLIISQGR